MDQWVRPDCHVAVTTAVRAAELHILPNQLISVRLEQKSLFVSMQVQKNEAEMPHQCAKRQNSGLMEFRCSNASSQ